MRHFGLVSLQTNESSYGKKKKRKKNNSSFSKLMKFYTRNGFCSTFKMFLTLQQPSSSFLFLLVGFCSSLGFWSHQGRQFILSITLAQAQNRHNCLARPAVTAQLASGLWCPFQGIHRPVGTNTRRLLHLKREGCCDPTRCNHPTKMWPNFSAQFPDIAASLH